jgi:hypothetical protein
MICQLVVNPQTGKPLDEGTLKKHFPREIAVGAAELRKLPMPPSTNDDPAGSASPRFALHGVIGIHLINEHRHYRAPIQEYNLQGSAALSQRAALMTRTIPDETQKLRGACWAGTPLAGIER